MAHSIKKKKSENNWIQWIATLAVVMMTTQVGIFFGWTSPNTARLLSEKSPIPCTPSDISWLASLSAIGSFLGAIVGSILVEYIGSRKAVLVTFLLFGVCWIFVLCANSIVWLYASRIIGGISSAMQMCCFSRYLSEISAPEVRGTLISLAFMGIPFGCVFGVIAETYLPRVSTLIYLSIVLIGMALLVFLKDTPYHLVKRGDMENAEKATLLYRKHIKVEEELKEIKDFAENSDSGIGDKLSQLRQPAVRRAMLLILVTFTLPDASGVMTIASYTEVILKTSGFNLVEPAEWVVYSSIVAVTLSCLTVKLQDKLGRRFALAVSSIATSVALAALGLQFYLLKSGYDVKNLQWLSVGALFLYSIGFNTGFGPVPCTLLSEMFPENVKGIAACLAALTSSLVAFIVVKSYQPVADWVGEAYIFWIHALVSILGVPCALFLLTETKGKTFQQIQDELQKK